MASDFELARQETVGYHEALFAGPAAGSGPGWWARPHRLVVDSLDLIDVPVHAYDLGAGGGRHTLLLADRLPPGSRVTAVDLLPVALDLVVAAADRAGVLDRVDTVVADIEEYAFAQADAGLVLAFSVLEHVRSPAALSAVLARCRAATIPGGLHVIGVFADRWEVDAGCARPAPVECPLTTGQARELLQDAYRGWDILREQCSATTTSQTRNHQARELRSTLVSLLARAPGRLTVHESTIGP